MKRKEGHTKWPDLNKIEVCSLCWLGEPVFELCQILLHPNLSHHVEGPFTPPPPPPPPPPPVRPPTTEDWPGGGGKGWGGGSLDKLANIL